MRHLKHVAPARADIKGMTSISELRRGLETVLTRERARLAARLRALGAAPDGEKLAVLARDIDAARQRR
ncbi:MAG: hypothetical protein ACYCUL_06260, partial [Metallibacterium scheffleri]